MYGVTGAPLYSASKYGVIGMVRSLGPQLESDGITVNAVAPNMTREYTRDRLKLSNRVDQDSNQ